MHAQSIEAATLSSLGYHPKYSKNTAHMDGKECECSGFRQLFEPLFADQVP
jgi:hypothetical protein